MSKMLTFGWRSNGNADGFEQDHGRLTIEVFWSDEQRRWSWTIWNNRMHPRVLDAGVAQSLEAAKHNAMKRSSVIERTLMKEEKKKASAT